MKKSAYAIIALALSCAQASCQESAAFSAAASSLLERLRFDKDLVALFKPSMRTEIRQLERISVAYDAKANTVSEERLPLPGISFEVDPGAAKRLVLDNRKAAKEKGYLAFVSEDGFGRGNDSIAVIRSSSQFDILSCMQTDGINYDIGNARLIAAVKAWNERYPMEIVGAGLDWMDAVFVGKPTDLSALAREAFELCPDAAPSAKALEDKMRRLNELYLVWN